MDNSEEKTIAYQQRMESIHSAAASFKREHFPADPFDDGVLVDASYLDVADLAAIYKAAKVLERQGNEAFLNYLIVSYKKPTDIKVRVNPLWVDANRQRKLEICELLHNFYWDTNRTFAEKRQQIIEMEDSQLLEYLRQAEESLGLTAAKMEVIINAE